MMSRDSG